ncbi:MAG: ATP-binding cassette domain-containing protein [Candidatus Shapirobacteria bacterium]|jgi:cell division transport system ATP-binding protein
MTISFSNVTKNFGIISAIKDVSFEIADREFVFIAGPSGAGKSTLLKLILGQIRPTDGNLDIDGVNFTQAKKTDIEKIRRRIGVIYQDYQLIADKSIEENIGLALDIISFPPSQINSRIDEVIKKVNLSSRRFLFPSQLSGGELQRASLARAIAIEPSVILADEPTGNLDNENSWILIKLLQDINRHYHTTIIMTTHNTDIIESLDKRIIYLRNGQIEKDLQNKSL